MSWFLVPQRNFSSFLIKLFNNLQNLPRSPCFAHPGVSALLRKLSYLLRLLFSVLVTSWWYSSFSITWKLLSRNEHFKHSSGLFTCMLKINECKLGCLIFSSSLAGTCLPDLSSSPCYLLMWDLEEKRMYHVRFMSSESSTRLALSHPMNGR